MQAPPPQGGVPVYGAPPPPYAQPSYAYAQQQQPVYAYAPQGAPPPQGGYYVPQSGGQYVVGAPQYVVYPPQVQAHVAVPMGGGGPVKPAYAAPAYAAPAAPAPDSAYLEQMERAVRLGFLRKVLGVLSLQVRVEGVCVCVCGGGNTHTWCRRVEPPHEV